MLEQIWTTCIITGTGSLAMCALFPSAYIWFDDIMERLCQASLVVFIITSLIRIWM